MSARNSSNQILIESDKYLSEIVLKIEEKNPQKYALKQIQDSLFDAAGDPDTDQLIRNKHDFLSSLLEVIDDAEKKETLKQFLGEIYRLAKTQYDPELHFENIKSYVKIGQLFDQNLIEALNIKLKGHVQKEVKYLQMQDPEYLDNEICDLAVGSIQNLTPQIEQHSQQQTYEIVLLYEIFNFRLATLDDEQAWDFMAQSILHEVKTTGLS